jgi:hypothetical protein
MGHAAGTYGSGLPAQIAAHTSGHVVGPGETGDSRDEMEVFPYPAPISNSMISEKKSLII